MKRVLVLFLIFISGAGTIIFLNLEWQNDRKLPVYQPNDINPELVDSSLHGRGRGINGGDHKISEFELIDQLNQKVTNKIMQNKIVLVDFFFVSCPSICPKMTNNLLTIHKHFKLDSSSIHIILNYWTIKYYDCHIRKNKLQ